MSLTTLQQQQGITALSPSEADVMCFHGAPSAEVNSISTLPAAQQQATPCSSAVAACRL